MGMVVLFLFAAGFCSGSTSPHESPNICHICCMTVCFLIILGTWLANGTNSLEYVKSYMGDMALGSSEHR